jgi:DNA-binding CsgD family transcriptional regulator
VTYHVTDSDLRRLLDVVDAGRSDAPENEGLPIGVLELAADLIQCEWLSFIEMDEQRRFLFFDQTLPVEAADPEDDGEGAVAFWSNYWDCISCSYPSVTGDDRSVTTISDFYSTREFHQTGMYADYLGPLGVEREAMMCLSAPPGRTRRLLFSRGRSGRDFDDRDRLLLSLLRPHLNELYQELEFRRRPQPELTPRQWELMRLVADGHSNAEIAKELVVSPTTVRTHLENIFQRLGVTSRTRAVAQAFPSAPY